MVVNIYGSYVEEDYTDNSLQIVFSSTKAMSPIVLAMLEERGLIDWYKPIATYWPEFGQHGKENLTVAELMRHELGLDSFNESIPWNVYLNHDNQQKPMHKYIEETTPQWAPHTRRAYHAVTRGLVENELVKRVDPKKRNVGKFFHEEITQPLGIDFWIGLPDEQFSRFHPMHEWPIYYDIFHVLIPYYLGTLKDKNIKLLLDVVFSKDPPRCFKSIINTAGQQAVSADDMCLLEALKTVSPSVNGVSNAKSLGKILALLANGGEIDGVQLLKPETITRMLAVTTPPMMDGGIGIISQFTDGGMAKNVILGIGDGDFFGWGGWGGSVVQFSPDLNAAVSFTLNGMGKQLIGDTRFNSIIATLSEIWKKKEVIK